MLLQPRSVWLNPPPRISLVTLYPDKSYSCFLFPLSPTVGVVLYWSHDLVLSPFFNTMCELSRYDTLSQLPFLSFSPFYSYMQTAHKNTTLLLSTPPSRSPPPNLLPDILNQAVTRWLVTFPRNSCGLCGVQSGNVKGFLLIIRLSHQLSFQ